MTVGVIALLRTPASTRSATWPARLSRPGPIGSASPTRSGGETRGCSWPRQLGLRNGSRSGLW